jgi:hypothetical protein
MTDSERYLKAIHGVQSAIAYEIGAGLSTDTTPKHLRVGVNSAMVNDKALTVLLMKKGLFTQEEYVAAVADAAEDELAMFEKKHPGITFW